MPPFLMEKKAIIRKTASIGGFAARLSLQSKLYS